MLPGRFLLMFKSLIKKVGTLLVMPVLSLNLASAEYYQGQLYYHNPVLVISKINLNQEFYPNDPKQNHVDKNIAMLEGSKLPTVKASNLILAAHSGNSNIAYFKELDKLKINDSIYVYYQDKSYKYVIADIYEVEKTGYVKIKRKQSKTTLTLITCKKGTNKQIVLISYLILTAKTS